MKESMRRRVVLGMAVLVGIALAYPAAAEPPAKKGAGGTAEFAVQGGTTVEIVGTAFCSEWTPLYSVAEGQRLVIEWMSASSMIFAGIEDPVDAEIRTWDGAEYIFHTLTRLDNSVVKAGSFFGTQRWSSMVRLYSEAGMPAEVRMCPDAELTDEVVGRFTFSGFVIDLP